MAEKIDFRRGKKVSPKTVEALAASLEGKMAFDKQEKSQEAIHSLLGFGRDASFFPLSFKRGIEKLLFFLFRDLIYPSGKNHLLIGDVRDEMEEVVDAYTSFGCVSDKLSLDKSGLLSLDRLKEALSKRTAAVFLSYASPLLGTLHPIWEIGEYLQNEGIFFHLDVTGALPEFFFSFDEMPVDAVSFDGTLLGAPLALGGLAVKKSALTLEEEPALDEEIITIGTLCEKVQGDMDEMTTGRVHLKNLFEQEVKKSFTKVEVLFQKAPRLGSVSCLSFPGVFYESLLFRLKERGILVDDLGERFIDQLKEMGFPPLIAQGGLVFHIPLGIGEKEIKTSASIIGEEAHYLLTLSKGAL